ncbi:hypothetical protein SPB21_21485 [Leptothoe sp. ISB3NOV94-8A]|uniref:hypothetical protein n=1 Tax=Adonisia turfae TaxID=2950184 RepID=UPI0013D6BFBB|nr:hypothetical protein [Adonisia turfae]
MPVDSLIIHFQHLEKASGSNLRIVTLAKTGDDEVAKLHLNVADTQLFCEFQSHSV